MLTKIKAVCESCTLCPLGKRVPNVKGKTFNPRLLSNMVESKFVVMGQNPGYNECIKREPFVGQAGTNFDKEIAKYGLSRKDFYITNVLHCYTDKNRPPKKSELSACKTIVNMELDYLKPKLIITLGAFAFRYFFPKETYKTSLGKILKHNTYGNVFPIYHPSGMNLANPDRRKKFEEDIAKLAGIVND